MELELQGASARHPAARSGSAPALHGVALRVAAGEQLAVIGPSGAGKTTLLHVLGAALPPQRGQLRLGGQDPWVLPRAALQRLRGQLFMAPQVPPLPPRQRVVTAVLAGRLPAQSLLASLRSLVYPSDIPAAFNALEPLVLKLGLSSIGLRVFSQNTGAQSLCRKLGYGVTSVNMLKHLGPARA